MKYAEAFSPTAGIDLIRRHLEGERQKLRDLYEAAVSGRHRHDELKKAIWRLQRPWAPKPR